MNRPEQSTHTPELTVTAAARVLGVDRRTVKGMIQSGSFRVRIAVQPNSRRPRYRIPESDVLALRNNYRSLRAGPNVRKQRKATKRIADDDLEHIRLNR
jgi:excisionase family DNA binding protein